MMLCMQTKVFITTNGGASWNNITNNLGDMPIHSVVIDHTDSSRIYLGAEIGVYTKLMSENVWSLYNPNLPNTTIEELEIVNGSNTIKAATWGRGLWEYSLVGRNNFPSILITKITDQPTDVLPLENIDQYVTSLISYDDILTSVFVKWSVNSLAFDNQIDMTNTVDSTWVSNSPIPNQAFNSKIYFKVFAVGSIGDTTETYKFMYNVREEKVCPSAGTMSYQGNITYVNFNAIDNVTGKTQPYTDYTSTDSTFIVINEDYDLSVNVSTDNGNYVYYVTAWVDWNHDDDFYDSGEEYLLGSAQNVADAPTNLSPFTISIPSNAAFGNTIMRISCNYNAYQTDPCASGFDGEVEDYLLVISDGFLDLNENPTIYHVNLFPNPSTENVNLIFSQLHNNMVISLKNELGQVVMNEKSINKKSTVIDLKKIDKGIYFLVLSSDDGEEVVKIIKN